MNINLMQGVEHAVYPSVQDEIDEHIEILRHAGLRVTGEVILVADPEYPGVYRVWHRQPPAEGHIESAGAYNWIWVDPDGEVVSTHWPWAVK